MSFNDLSDEIIQEILSPALRVPNETFRDTSNVSPFFNITESSTRRSSNLLLVCKSWLRVATPLLYHVVILRSSPQARALERVLRSNKRLATFIKKLRVEGGFGPSMHHILQLGKNIEEVWLLLSIWIEDNASGLCSGLSLVNPRRLIVSHTLNSSNCSNAHTRKLVNTVCECITKWKRLAAVDLPSDYCRRTWTQPMTDLYAALCKAPLLKEITLQGPQFSLDFLLRLAENPSSSLEVIRIKQVMSGFSTQFLDQLMANETLAKLLRFDSLDDEDDKNVDDILPYDEKVAPPENDLTSTTFGRSFVALQSVSNEVKAKIWSNIIYFSLLLKLTAIPCDGSSPHLEYRRLQSKSYSLHHINQECTHKYPRTNILLVSRFFYDTAMSHYYRYCLLDGYSEVLRVGEQVSRNAALGSAIYSLTTYSCQGADANSFLPFIVNATNLVHLNSKGFKNDGRFSLLDYQSLTILAIRVGSTLQTLTGHCIARPPKPKSPTPLYAFTVLRELEWDSSIRLEFTAKNVPINAFPCLEALTFISKNDTFLRLLECMALPALRRVIFPIAKRMAGAIKFLERHGNKLVSLNMEDPTGCWALCPSLSVIEISGHPVFEPHAKVEAIVFTLPNVLEGTVSVTFRELGSIDFGKDYPALTAVQVYACRWPTTERDIAKGFRKIWVTWSERLMKWNVKLIDQDENHWEPRLK